MRFRALVAGIASIGVVAAVVATAPVAAVETADAPRWTLEDRDCESESLADWQCYSLIVPLDWDDLDDTRTASIAMAVKPAAAPKRQRIGAMTFNPGGPGESGVALASAIHSQLPDQMQRKFDLVAWDPRGIGASTPQLSGCGVTPPPEPANPYVPPATGPVDWRAYTQSYVEATAPIITDCYERNLDVAPYLGTWQVIHDLDAMREALGEEQWTYWGMSYGTRIGYWYAREFPDRLRAFALDGSWPANMGLRTWAGMDTWSWAYATEQFGSQFGKKMPAKFDRVLGALNRRTIVSDGQEFTRWDILPAIYVSISYQTSYPAIVEVINQAYRALFHPNSNKAVRAASKMKRALETLEEEPDISGSYTIYMINCSDLDGRPSLDSVVAMAQSADENNSVYAGNSVMAKGTFCTGLPESMVRKPANIGRPYALPAPPVIINSIGDTRTPWLGGKQISGYLAGSTFITYEGTQHVTYLQTPSTCVNDTVTTYFLTAVSPGGTRSCDYAPSPGS
jgi:pimeloyl-ACP methyl ester carboxylesterase